MATLIHIGDMYEYRTVVDRVIAGGEKANPRGLNTLDLGPTLVQIEDPQACWASGIGRGLSPRIAAVEAVQLICGFHSPDLMNWASPNFRRYQDAEGQPFWGAYGRRIGHQLHNVVDKLRRDRQTRQAVVTLWDPERDNDPGHRDYPCTVGFGLRVVHGRLDMWTTMRSNDVWLGFPYDVFQFTQLQLTVAGLLGVPVGSYAHFAGSLHIYTHDLDQVEKLRYASRAIRTYQPQGLTGSSVGAITTLGRNMVNFPYIFIDEQELNESEQWYLRQLSGYATRDTADKTVLG